MTADQFSIETEMAGDHAGNRMMRADLGLARGGQGAGEPAFVRRREASASSCPENSDQSGHRILGTDPGGPGDPLGEWAGASSPRPSGCVR